jgi:hypothetical protein
VWMKGHQRGTSGRRGMVGPCGALRGGSLAEGGRTTTVNGG